MDLFLSISPYAVSYTIPLLITALGGLYCERSGVVNIGLEGLMLVGTFSAALFISSTEATLGYAAVWLGILVAMAAGVLVSLLHAFASINLNANQVVSGTAINMLAAAVTVFFARDITGSGNIRATLAMNRYDVPGLSRIPIIGDMFFKGSYHTTWIVLGILFLSVFIINKTSFGLRLRACGENPHAADAAGINVRRVRYSGVMISGAFAALGGCCGLLTYSKEFNGSMNGLGFLALAALIFGQWKPLGILASTFFFGFAQTIANVSSIVDEFSSVPTIFLKTFPFVITIVALIFFSRTSAAPRASGQTFDPGRR